MQIDIVSSRAQTTVHARYQTENRVILTHEFFLAIQFAIQLIYRDRLSYYISQLNAKCSI